MASIDLIRASNGSGDAVKATVTNARVISSTTLQVSAITNFPSKFIATVGSVDGTGAFVPATVTVFNGHTSSGNIEIDSFAPGYTDLGNTPGQIVVLKPTTAWANEIADVVGAAHNDNGTLKANSVNTAAITDANVTTAKIADTAVTSSKIDFTTLLKGRVSVPGSSGISSTFTTSATIDISTVPTGAIVEFASSGTFYRGGNVTVYMRLIYNSVNYTASSYGVNNVTLNYSDSFTKVSGQNSITYQIAKDTGGTGVDFVDGVLIWKVI